MKNLISKQQQSRDVTELIEDEVTSVQTVFKMIPVPSTRGQSRAAFPQQSKIFTAVSSLNHSSSDMVHHGQTGNKTKPFSFLQQHEKLFIRLEWLITFKYVQTFRVDILKQTRRGSRCHYVTVKVEAGVWWRDATVQAENYRCHTKKTHCGFISSYG